MKACMKDVACALVQMECTLKLFGHVEKLGSGEFVKVYENEIEGPNRRLRPLGRWKNRVEEYLEERGINGRGVLEEARRECWDREKWRFYCRAHSLGGRTRRK